ncbi:uncharacterized protein [Mytilus edulis]|uniref:uncharacterized protein n=1 Tax=Mytilus edulis TaxID=6550 RepID=UPI0039EF0591
MKYLIQLLILIKCHEIKGVLEWTVVGKVTDYGQNVTLFCNVPNCCPKDAGWDRWTPHQRTLFIDVKTGRSNKKYDGKVEKDGYTLVIQNLTKNDLNVSYSCLYGVTLGEQKYLLEEDVFTFISTKQPDAKTGISEGQIAGIIVGVVVLVALTTGLFVFHPCTQWTPPCSGGTTYTGLPQKEEAVPDINTNVTAEQLNDTVVTHINTNEAAKQLNDKDIPERTRYTTGIQNEVRKYVRIQVIGKSHAGKTSLVRRLLGKRIDDVKRTDGIDIDKTCRIRTSDGEWIVGEVDDQITDATIENMDDNVLEVKNKNVNAGDLIECSIWDFAGRKEYYVTHQTFITQHAIYILVADITDPLTLMQYNDDHFSFDSRGDYIDFWLDSIHCIRDDIQESKAKEIHPPVLMVVTGIDKVENKEDVMKSYRQQFHHIFGFEDKVGHIRGKIHFISNINSPEEDFKILQKHISNIAQEMNFVDEEIPTKWIELENALAVLRKKKKKEHMHYCERLENIEKLAQKILLEEDELILFLNYQHKIGNVIFFEDQRDYIVLEPSWLVDCFRCLVCDNYIGEDCSFTELYKLTNSGELSDLLINHLFKKVPTLRFEHFKKHILEVMEKFDIIVKPKSIDSYYMPCMIKTSTTLKDIKKTFNVQESNCTPWLVLEFTFLPIAYANSIMFNYIKTKAICKERSQTGDGLPSIFAGKAVIYLDETKSSKLAICFSNNAISLQIWKYDNKDVDNDTKKQIIEQLCNKIEELETRHNHPLQYNITSKCSTGNYSSRTGRIRHESLTKTSNKNKYLCREHLTFHNKTDIAETWLKHAAAIEKNKQANREKKMNANKEDMKKQEGKKSQDIKTKRPKINKEMDIQLPWLVDANEFESMLSHGTFESYENRLSLGGPCKAGKSTLASVLIGEEIQKNWESTDGLVIYFGRNGIDLEEGKMVPLKKSEHGERGRKDLAKILRGNPQFPKLYEQVNQKRKSTTPERTVTATPVKSFISESPADDAEKLTKDTSSLTKQCVTQSHGSMTESVNEHKGQPITIMDHKQTTHIQIFDIKELQIQSDILTEVRTGKYKIEIAPSDLIDFGGQKSFDMTHQLFIQHSGSFLLMFDGRVGLHDQLDEYPDGVNAKSILKHWVESILTYSEDTDDIMPKIMFAATHRDLCKKTEMMKECFIRDIKDMFPDHPKNAHLHLDTVYFINGVDKNDPEIQRLTDQVVQFAMEQPSWGQRRPMQWVPLELQLSNMRMQNINIITKEVLQNVNKLNNDLSLNESQLNDFLLVQHSLGKLMYYSFTGLDNFIIIHPPALVNILRSFVTDEKFFPKDKKNKSILQQLSETGEISKRDLLSLWQQDSLRQYMANDAIKEFVVQLLIHLDILIVPKTVKTDSFLTDEYLVPCMIKGIRPSNFLSLKSLEGRTISLRYSLTRQSIPTALAYKIIGATINAWPLQYDDQKKLCLYHKAAIVNVSECNELRVFIEDNRVMVYLTNKESIISISPDIAASIQECLTKNFEMAILFHYKSCGTNINQNKVSEKYTIEVGYPCVSEACYKSSNAVGKIQSWTCPNSKKIEHQSKYLVYWTFNKKQKECGEQCEGLTEQELKAEPSEKHLVRLAKRINVKSIETLLSNLGVETNEWVMIKNDYDSHSITDKVYIALTRWKNSKISPKSTLKDLSDAMRDVDPKKHYICQVFRETVEELDFASINSKDFPGDDLLEGLSTHIGNCPMQLGIELGLSLADFDNMLFCRKDLPGLIKDILLEWRKRSNDKTIHSLVIALQQVNSGGIRYLQMK